MENIKIEIHKRNLDKRKQGVKLWKIPEAEKKQLLTFLDKLALGQVNKGKKICEARQLKYLDLLRTPLEFWNKEVTRLTLKDIENFEKALTSNKIKSRRFRKPLMPNTKADIKKLLKIYFRWRELDSRLYSWLDTSDLHKTPDYLSEQEIEKLYKNCKNNEERFLIAILFDSGARAEEFHNIRYEDIQLPTGSENYVKLTLKEEYSKTKGRVISLYWKNSLEAVKDYLKQRESEGIKSKDVVFKNKYDNSRQILFRLGKKVLNKSIHYHLFRHSSATYYASKLNRQQLCIRFGWAFSSRMPDVYITRSGVESKELDEKFESTELQDLNKKLERERQEKDLKIDELKAFVTKIYADMIEKQAFSEESFKELEKMKEKL